MFVQIPALAKYEWHPFTISSTPEQQGFIWLHIRSVGTWTNKLYEYFEERNRLRRRGTLQLQLPKDQQLHNMHELEQAVRAWDDASSDLESLNDVHPLAVSTIFEERIRGGGGEQGSVSHGQDFSHLYAQPTIINVQLEDEDEKGIEVCM